MAAGLSRQAIGRRLGDGRWIKTDHAVYRAATTPESWELLLMAACLCGPAAASHRSAARWSHLAGFRDARLEVTALRHRRRRSNTAIWHESRFLQEGRDVIVLDGIPVTTATRTIIDLSWVASVDEIEIAFDDACNRGLTSVDRVAADLERLQRQAGTRNIRAVLERKASDAQGSSHRIAESPLETRTAIILRDSDLPKPVPQFEVFDGYQFVGRVDFAWPHRRVALEVDGYAFHGDRAAWERDRVRRTRLAAAGWRVHHVTHEGLTDPHDLIAGLRKSVCVH